MTLLFLTNILCLFFCTDVPVSTSSISSTTISFEKELCMAAFPETGKCPPFQEDWFGIFHNYTNPRPITAEQIEQGWISCLDRLYVLVIGRFSMGQTSLAIGH